MRLGVGAEGDAEVKDIPAPGGAMSAGEMS